jgi:hypothetical protein
MNLLYELYGSSFPIRLDSWVGARLVLAETPARFQAREYNASRGMTRKLTSASATMRGARTRCSCAWMKGGSLL